MSILEPNTAAASFRDVIRGEIRQKGLQVKVIGILASDNPASVTYANYAQKGCTDVDIAFDLIKTKPEQVMALLERANNNPDVHGIFVYYPIFGDERDAQIRNLVSPKKDVEGLTDYWIKKLYNNDRFDDADKKHKAILPCTSLAIIKLLEMTDAYMDGGLPFKGQTIAVFNRSDVVGKPLAHMLTNDGAKVYSFDVNGGILFDPHGAGPAIGREQALKEADVVITGVPSDRFEKIKASELKSGGIGLNFSSLPNFEDDAKEAVSLYIPRVGTLTVAMCLRNALRLFHNYHQR